MKYIYHLKPEKLEGSSLIPLNHMNKQSTLYNTYVKKYEGRESLMDAIIPILDCKWNDVVQFSSLDPQIIVVKLKEFLPNLKLVNTEYYKIPIENILLTHEAVIFNKNPNKKQGDFLIKNDEVKPLTFENYKELSNVPLETIKHWENVKLNGGQYLWFNFIPHILVKGVISTKDFEICTLIV